MQYYPFMLTNAYFLCDFFKGSVFFFFINRISYFLGGAVAFKSIDVGCNSESDDSVSTSSSLFSGCLFFLLRRITIKMLTAIRIIILAAIVIITQIFFHIEDCSMVSA